MFLMIEVDNEGWFLIMIENPTEATLDSFTCKFEVIRSFVRIDKENKFPPVSYSKLSDILCVHSPPNEINMNVARLINSFKILKKNGDM